MDETNGRARVDVGFEDERRNLAAEIMRLSPPAPGCKERARRILECEFSLNELEVLAEALRDGFGAVVKPETQGVALQNIFAIARSQRVPADPQVDFTVGGPRTRLTRREPQDRQGARFCSAPMDSAACREVIE